MSAAAAAVAERLDARRRRARHGWYVYDWANSAYATTVVAVFLGPYLTSVAYNAACGRPVSPAAPCPVADARVTVLGLEVLPGAYFSFLLAFSLALQVLVLPVVGALADRTPRPHRLLGACAFLGSVATAGLYLVGEDRYLLGGGLYLLAQASFGASLVVYNAFLPRLAGPDERDRVSARGWALGYLGGGLLLLANLVFFSLRDRLGVSTGQAVRISLLSAGLWWALFTLVSLRGLAGAPALGRPGDPGVGPVAEPGSGGVGALAGGFRQLRATLAGARRHPRTLLFLGAYLVYNDGIQSVINLASVYGGEELGFPQETLISAILLVQFVAFLGALLLGAAAARFGAKRVVLASLLLWTLVLAAAYLLPARATVAFFALSAGIGMVLGGTQALSRSLFAQLVPAGREAEYFSLYEVSERGTSWLGALLFGLVYSATGSYRQAIVSLLVFFVLGFVLLAPLDVRRGIADVGNRQPARI